MSDGAVCCQLYRNHQDGKCSREIFIGVNIKVSIDPSVEDGIAHSVRVEKAE